jgi:hypothetical protein
MATHVRMMVALLLLSTLGCADDTQQQQEQGIAVTVTYGEEGHQVALADIAPVELGVRLSDVVKAAWPELDRTALVVDFIASDGFRPSSRSPCRDLMPVPGSLLDQGYLDPATANLTWDESLGFPGCLHPNGVATVVLLEPSASGVTVRVQAGDVGVDMDLSLLPTVDFGGAPMVALDVVVTASGAVAAPHLYDYDFADASGARPTDGGESPLGWDQLTKGWIHPVTRDLAWDATLGLAEAWSVHDAATIYLIEKPTQAASVLVVHGTDQAEVDLGALPLVLVGIEYLVGLQMVVETAAIVATPATFGYDFECSDGYFVIEGHADRTPISWDALGLGWMGPASRNLTWDGSLGFGTPWNARDVVKIHIRD